MCALTECQAIKQSWLIELEVGPTPPQPLQATEQMNDVATRRLLCLFFCFFFFLFSCLTNVAAEPNQRVLSAAVRGLSTSERGRGLSCLLWLIAQSLLR